MLDKAESSLAQKHYVVALTRDAALDAPPVVRELCFSKWDEGLQASFPALEYADLELPYLQLAAEGDWGTAVRAF